MDKIRIAILGAGRIAHRMANTVNQMDIAQITAIASRDAVRSAQFAREHTIAKSYGSYGEMLEDKDIDLVYIATPVSCHAEQITMCLNAEKHVLCEKAFTINAEQAKQVLLLAQQKGLLVAEAIWPRYMPMTEKIKELCAGTMIGQITSLTANLGYQVMHKTRLLKPELAGGALLEVGIYPLTFALIAFGYNIAEISATAHFRGGVDLQDAITLAYQDGRIASLYASITSLTDRSGVICGERGYAVIENINNFERITVHDINRGIISEIVRPLQISGYEYQIQAVVDAINQGLIECPQMPHNEIIATMEVMDCIRRNMGIKYPMEA